MSDRSFPTRTVYEERGPWRVEMMVAFIAIKYKWEGSWAARCSCHRRRRGVDEETTAHIGGLMVGRPEGSLWRFD
jgi:hypothetical protein